MYLRSISIVLSLLLCGIFIGIAFSSQKKESRSEQSYPYHLFDPEMAPKSIKPQVMRGYQIMQHTHKLLPEYSGDILNCRNCHFGGGNNFGGHENGFALVGVDHLYPKKKANGEEYSLAQRMNSCFIKSMNGKPLPLDSPDMLALVAYMEWISHGIPKLESYPWLGEKKLRSHHTPNANNGAKIFETKCAMCHGKNGEGQARKEDLGYPPLWGDQSFNDGAGMNQVATFATFVYHNMPFGDPGLTVEEALDVAAYVTTRPRPHFSPQ